MRPRASSHDSRVDAQRAALDLDMGKSSALPRKRHRSPKAREGPKCQRPKLRALVTLKTHPWRLARGPMPAYVRDLLEPTQRLGVEVVIADELACVEEALATVADRPLDLALGPCSVRSTRSRSKAPVLSEAQKLGVQDQRATFAASVVVHDGAHLVEEQLRRHAAEVRERRLKPADQRLHVLATIELQPQQPGIGEHDQQRVPPAPWQIESAEIDLALKACRRLEAHDRIS